MYSFASHMYFGLNMKYSDTKNTVKCKYFNWSAAFYVFQNIVKTVTVTSVRCF